MHKEYMIRGIFAALMISILAYAFGSAPQALAASTTMNLSPQKGSFGSSFPVNLVIDGHGDRFNAAEATVQVSSNLRVQDLILGDCNFSFLQTPTAESLSFQGVIMNSYLSKCTVYSLKVVPIMKGDGSITLTKASVRRYGDAANVLSSTQGGRYTITSVAKETQVPGSQTISTSEKLYSVLLTVLSSDEQPLTGAQVTLSPVTKKNQLREVTDSNGIVEFNNVDAGIYDVIVEKDSAKVGENIINVNGSNHVLKLGINIAAQKNNPLLSNRSSVLGVATTSPYLFMGIMSVGILVGIGIILLFLRIKTKSKVQG